VDRTAFAVPSIESKDLEVINEKGDRLSEKFARESAGYSPKVLGSYSLDMKSLAEHCPITVSTCLPT